VTVLAPVRPVARWLLGVEFGVVFFGLVVVYTLFFRGTSPIPVLVVLAVAAVVYLLRADGFDRRNFWRASALRGEIRPMLILWAATAVVCAGAVLLTEPSTFLILPREEIELWAVIMVGYPLASVYPQEVLFRAFIFQRYRPVFGNGYLMVAASAAAFGFVHIAFGNWVAVVLSAAGGWIFAARYRRTRSLLTVGVEHALYGLLMFTVGLGQYFYHGAA
jgi:uncharacterized protein